ncbi:MAG TPA: DUF177 domain-containing protein [Allosphingosinicella sp.]|nr:DUF177 domain-containing protein [Allosphingosinicella sp.]
MSTPEFSRTVRVDTLGEAPRTLSIEADERERAALAERFGYVAIAGLSADVALTRTGETVTARGRLRAALEQSCVATGEPLGEALEESFAVEFRPHPAAGADEEIEISESELDVVFYDGATIDVGEAVAETLSLAVEPYPRSHEAERALREAGVRSEEEARAESSPFAALKDRLGG